MSHFKRASVAVLMVVALWGAPAHATPRALAVMDAQALGVAKPDLDGLHRRLQESFGTALSGSEFELVPREELRVAVGDMPGCSAGTCDIQAARHCEAAAVVSVEAVCQQRDCSLSMRMFETRGGSLLARAMLSGASVGELQSQVPATASALGTALLQAHTVARAERPYQLRPLQGTPAVLGVAAAPPAPRAEAETAPRVSMDSGEAAASKVLHDATPGLNACYEDLLTRKKNARGRMVVILDVEASGKVAHVRVDHSQLHSAEMDRCVSGRLRRLAFPASRQDWQVSFPLVFVSSKG